MTSNNQMKILLSIVFSLILALHQVEQASCFPTSYKPKVSVTDKEEKDTSIIFSFQFPFISFKNQSNVINLRKQLNLPTNFYGQHSYYVGFV